MHIAAGVGTKILSIFGPTTKRLGFYPYTKKAILIEKELDCKPCSSHGPQRCPKLHHNCMRRITPNEVFETLLQLI
jgi:heptosyltransferase-2